MLILPNSARNARKPVRKLPPVTVSRRDELNYYDALNQLNEDMYLSGDRLINMYDSGASAYSMSQALQSEHDKQVARYAAYSGIIASSFVLSTNKSNKNKVERGIASSFNIPTDQVTIVEKPRGSGGGSRPPSGEPPGYADDLQVALPQEIDDLIDVYTMQNAQLIKSIPQEYFADVADAVARNFRGQPQVGDVSLQKRIKYIGGVTDNRARFIARDQTAKLTGNLTQARHQALGINSYVWRTSKDNRVVGDPTGLWPNPTKGHGNHYIREGVVFSYSSPPSDGHPKQAYGCRCEAEALLDLNTLDVYYNTQ